MIDSNLTVAANVDRGALTVANAAAMFDPLLGGSRKVVVFGTGDLGKRLVAACALSGIEVCALSDNNVDRWGTHIAGLGVLSPADAAERFASTAVFVIAIYNPSRVIEQVRALGCRVICTYPQFFAAFPSNFEGITGLALPEVIVNQRRQIEKAADLLYDSKSKREYAAQLDWRTTLDDSTLPAPSNPVDMHFDPNVYALSQNETLVDCGAYDGDSLRAFLGRTDSKFNHVYALEPDPKNRARLEEAVAGLSGSVRSSISVLPYAAGERNGIERFAADMGVASWSSTTGDIEVECRKLDDIVDRPVTLIKMDIEGSELDALRGAASLIRVHRPILAICAYHYCEHLWELPLLLHSLAPDHRIVLRRYAEQCWETVYYAIPSERFELT